MSKRVLIAVLVTVWCCVSMSVALAHGDISESSPTAGSKLMKAPRNVSVTFTETPTKGASQIRVRDGCRRDVTKNLTLSDHTIEAALTDAQPGSWRVTYRIVSAEDGHPSKGGLSFDVRGRRDCNEQSQEAPEGSENEEAPGAAPPQQPSSSDDGLPWAAIGIGTGVLLVGALLLRRSLG